MREVQGTGQDPRRRRGRFDLSVREGAESESNENRLKESATRCTVKGRKGWKTHRAIGSPDAPVLDDSDNKLKGTAPPSSARDPTSHLATSHSAPSP